MLPKDQELAQLQIKPETITKFVGAAIFGARANIDFYKKTVLGDDGWW